MCPNNHEKYAILDIKLAYLYSRFCRTFLIKRTTYLSPTLPSIFNLLLIVASTTMTCLLQCSTKLTKIAYRLQLLCLVIRDVSSDSNISSYVNRISPISLNYLELDTTPRSVEFYFTWVNPDW